MTEFIINLEMITKNFERIKNSSKADIVAYAIKANYHPKILEIILSQEGSKLEVATIGEYNLAKQFTTPDKILFNGFVTEEVKETLKDDLESLFCITAYSIEDLEEIGKLAKETGQRIRIGVRFDFQEKLKEFEKQGTIIIDAYKGLGIPESEEKRLKKTLKEYESLFELKVAHAMTGHLITDSHQIRIIVEHLEEKRKKYGFEYVDIGGGFKCQSRLEEEGKIIEDLFKNINQQKKIIIEPGRYIVEDACKVKTKIIRIINYTGRNKVIVIDTGMNLLIPLKTNDFKIETDIKHETEIAMIKGCLPSNADTIGYREVRKDLEEGDELTILNTGAYTLNLENNLGLKKDKTEVRVIEKEITYTELTDLIESLVKEEQEMENIIIYHFGSGLQKENKEIKTDYDILFIGEKEKFETFKQRIKERIQERYGEIKIGFRETIKELKPECDFYIHTLYFKDKKEFEEKEWPTIIKEITKRHKKITKKGIKFPRIEITDAEQIIKPLRETYEKSKNNPTHHIEFKRYLDKTIPKLQKEYPLFKEELTRFYERVKEE